ncbi:NAD(P)H-binding protein [Agrobacterium sp. FDAARGOS_525]|uniref:NAD(P)H-binding protein n=1 Tax=Agrobacterium sp. FDAARGOS_525 TaxID=2420311 RepID=UPI001AEC9B8B
MAKIALIGASGNAGSRILKELSDRGHHVTAIARSPKDCHPAERRCKERRCLRSNRTSKLLAGHDAVISSVHFTATTR